MKKLLRLTQVREQAALARMAAAEAEMTRAKQRIEALRATPPDAGSPDEARMLAKWSEWRSRALEVEISKLANLRAAHRRAAIECGRYIAEHAVAEQLAKRAAAEARQLRDRRT